MASQTGHIELKVDSGLAPGRRGLGHAAQAGLVFAVALAPPPTSSKPRIGGRQRWITLGRHGGLTPADARTKAERMLAEIDSGCDPTRERRAPSYIEFFVETHKEMGLGREELESSSSPETGASWSEWIQSGHTGNAEDLS